MVANYGKSADSCLLPTLLTFTVGLALALSSVNSAESAKNKVSDDLEIKVGRTVEITSSYRYCWFPSVHQFPKGEIMVDMMMSPDEVNPEGDFSAYCISKDGGLTWSRRYTMGPGTGTEGAFTEDPRRDGTHWLLYSYPEPYPEGQSQQFHDSLTKFSRGGMEIYQDREVLIQLSQPAYMAPMNLFDRSIGNAKVIDGKVERQIRGMPYGWIIDALNGDLLAPMYYTTQRDRDFYSHGLGINIPDGLEPHLRDVLLRSKDGGQTWKEESTIAAIEPGEKPWPWEGAEGPNELTVVRLADNRLYAVFRTGSDAFLGQTWSADDGKTWKPPVSSGFKGVYPRVRRLSNGMLALTTGRPGPVVIMFNTDGTGEEWSHATELFAGMSTHYTDLIEVEPGKLFVVYDSVPYGWHAIPFTDTKAKNTIYGTFVEVRKKRG